MRVDLPQIKPTKAKHDHAYVEILQEVRVAQAGIQLLLGFLPSMAFTQRFSMLDQPQHVAYIL